MADHTIECREAGGFSPQCTAWYVAPGMVEASEVAEEDLTVDIYTDGACSGNPGPGGWGVLLRWRGKERELCGGEPETTNNRMELMAAIVALETLKRPVVARLHTDSKYVRDGITEWLPNWKARGWKTAAKKPVKNVDLWQRLEKALEPHRVQWHWVKGHAGHPENERADELARLGLERARGGEAEI